MTKLTITIPEVIPWKRPGLSRNRFYDAQKVDKVRYAAIAKQAMIAQDIAFKSLYSPSDGVSMTVTCFIAMPDSWSNTRRLNMLGKIHRQKPDSDNVSKFIMDAWKGIMYKDDCQVAPLHVDKFWALETKTVIEVEGI